MIQPLILYSDNPDPTLNLAWEEYLFEQTPVDIPILMLWSSDRAVVIGRNQIPWKETDLKVVRQSGVFLCRRISGGGTVYHDPGNLNFTFITAGSELDRTRHFAIIIEALSRLGFDAKVDINNSITIGRKKVSGNAFRMTKKRCLHHGTILVRTDPLVITRFCHSALSGMIAGGVSSKPAEVTSLSASIADITVERVADEIAAQYSVQWKNPRIDLCSQAIGIPKIVQTTIEKHRSWEWPFAHSPTFTLRIEEGGGNTFSLSIERGRIAELHCSDDAPPNSEKARGDFMEIYAGQKFERAILDRNGNQGNPLIDCFTSFVEQYL